MRYLFGVIAIIDKRLIGKQPYVQHYSECDILCWYYCNPPPPPPPPPPPSKYEGYLFVTYLEGRVCGNTGSTAVVDSPLGWWVWTENMTENMTTITTTTTQ